jgi:hypothetical protein
VRAPRFFEIERSPSLSRRLSPRSRPLRSIGTHYSPRTIPGGHHLGYPFRGPEPPPLAGAIAENPHGCRLSPPLAALEGDS